MRFESAISSTRWNMGPVRLTAFPLNIAPDDGVQCYAGTLFFFSFLRWLTGLGGFPSCLVQWRVLGWLP